MAFSLAPNCSVLIYRGFTASNPYPLASATPAASNVPGLIKHHMQNGRFGKNAAGVHWTHKLYLADTQDVRDAFNSWESGAAAEDPTQADTVLIGDYPLTGYCCAFYVVMVQRSRKLSAFLVYLDRVQPRITGGCTRAVVCGTCGLDSSSWTLTPTGITNGYCATCASLNSVTRTLNKAPDPANPADQCYWQSDPFAFCSFTDARWVLFCDNANFWVVQLRADYQSDGTFTTFVEYLLPINSYNCDGPTNTFTYNSLATDTICSTWPATLTLTRV